AVSRALAEAGAAGVGFAHWRHLLVGVLGDPTNRATELITEIGDERGAWTEKVPDGRGLSRSDRPMVGGASVPVTTGLVTNAVGRRLRLAAFLFRVRLLLARAPAPMVFGLEYEAIRQAVRLGAAQVHTPHLLIAVCALEEQLVHKGWELDPTFVAENSAGSMLRDLGASSLSLAHAAASHPVADGEADRHGFWRRQKANPPTGLDVATAIARASARAKEIGHQRVGVSHVLLQLVEGAGPAASILADVGVDSRLLASALRSTLGQVGRT
ncbi:MAG TPA: Clp protease N-terminal domain-containing protein, partial [Micromonosporaceae bacterium]